MKKKTILAALVLAAIFILAILLSKRQPVAVQTTSKTPLNVSVQSAGNSTALTQTVQYPAITAGDQEATLSANISGTITQLNFDLGQKVFQGKQLITIDEIGNNSEVGENGLKSSQIQSLELAADAAKQSYKAAKDVYDHSRTFANKEAKKIASLQRESAEAALNGALNNRLVASPISGTITQRSVSLGDSISIGQPIATISKTALTKIQFFVDKGELSNFKTGTKLNVNEDGNIFPAIVSRIAPQADLTTKRFLIEAKPSGKNSLLIGSVINVSLDINLTAASGNLILPLSAITIGQNESYIFIADNGKAKKVNINIVKVEGEFAEIKTDISPDAQIIINGSKLVQDGDPITVQ